MQAKKRFITTNLALIIAVLSIMMIPITHTYAQDNLSKSLSQGETTGDNSPPPEVVEMDKEIEKNLADDPDAQKYLTGKTLPMDWIIVLGGFGAVFLIIATIGGIAVFFYIKKKAATQKKVGKTKETRDQKRKEDLQKIRVALSAYYKTHNCYPSAESGEFTVLLSTISPPVEDPFEGQDLGFGGQKYGYYYDNQSLDPNQAGQIDTQSYRLWCLLENENDPEIDHNYDNQYHWMYLKTSADPLEEKVVSPPEEPAVEQAQETLVKQTPSEQISVTPTPPETPVEPLEIEQPQQAPAPEDQQIKIARDQKRKEDLKRIQKALVNFYQTNQHYPEAESGEFAQLLSELSPPAQDPLENQETGFQDQRYGYFYDNLTADERGETQSDTQAYRLWCLLENENDPEIIHDYDDIYHWIYMKTHLDPFNE